MTFSIHYVRSGRHYHCRVYIARDGVPMGLCGTLIFTEPELAEFKERTPGCEWVDDAQEVAA